jgi:hypothetical protein
MGSDHVERLARCATPARTWLTVYNTHEKVLMLDEQAS